MKKLLLLGKEYSKGLPELDGYEVWALGTDRRDIKADRFYEVHGIDCGRDTHRFATDIFRSRGYPCYNSIALMLAQAIEEARHDFIWIVGSPCVGTKYTEERASIAFMCGVAMASGIDVKWQGGLTLGKMYMEDGVW